MRRRGVLGTIALFLVVVIMLGVIGGAVYMGIKAVITELKPLCRIFELKPFREILSRDVLSSCSG